MAQFGTNSADLPIAMTLELREEGRVWVVDIHIRVRRVTEFDISTEDVLLSKALRGAYLGLNNHTGLVRHAHRANQAYGVEV